MGRTARGSVGAKIADLDTSEKSMTRLSSLTLTGAFVFLAACGSAPDGNSGGDAFRNEAQNIPLEDWATGELNRDDGDTTDWRSISVEEGSDLKVELSAETKGSVVAVGVYDKFGAPLGKEGQVKGGGEVLSVALKAPSSGPLFLRVAHRGGGKTVYSVRAVVADGGDGGGGGPDL
jgi:hypothetical protein